jgi:hypothetical protein
MSAAVRSRLTQANATAPAHSPGGTLPHYKFVRFTHLGDAARVKLRAGRLQRLELTTLSRQLRS